MSHPRQPQDSTLESLEHAQQVLRAMVECLPQLHQSLKAAGVQMPAYWDMENALHALLSQMPEHQSA